MVKARSLSWWYLNLTKKEIHSQLQDHALGMCSKRKECIYSAMKRTREWIYSQEIPTDVTVVIGDTYFSLHKFPLVSKCGYIKKLVSKPINANKSVIKITGVPGGAEAFDLAMKFCYGVNFEIGIDNIAMLRCVAEYLEMTDDYAIGNLVRRTEAYLNEVALKSLPACVSILISSKEFIAMAEQIKLVNRCIDSIAYLAYKYRVEGGDESANSCLVSKQRDFLDWWAEDLCMLGIDLFRRVIIAMIARGFKQHTLGPILVLYAQKSLRGLETFGMGKKMELKEELEKRVVIETIVSLLPRERNVLSVSFLAMLIRSAIYVDTTVSCRCDLEMRIALQLGQAALDDLLIPAYSITGNMLFDVDTVKRIMKNYLEYAMKGNCMGHGTGEEVVFVQSNDLEKVGKLMENYLAEIASDPNLTVSNFTGLAELVPEQSRVNEDGLYRALDIFLKAHPTLSETDKKQVCSLMNCEKLSREACIHAAQNERLPTQVVIQVLYYEQRRLQESINGTINPFSDTFTPCLTLSLYPFEGTPPSDEHLNLRRENEDLKLELLNLKMRLNEVERFGVVDNSSVTSSSLSASTITSVNLKPTLPRKSFLSSVSKKLGQLFVVAASGDSLAPSMDHDKEIQDCRNMIL